MQTRVRRAFQIAALQSDGYRSSLSRLLPSGRKNVYMYIDNELDDVDHLCCMAHARAKFKYAYEQGGDERALSFLEWIGQLYGFEDEYKLQDIPPDEIKRRRNDSRTTDIMIAMSTRLNELLLDENAHLGDMMQKALRYLNKFWKQLFTYSFNHTFIATCQMMGLSVLKYFKNLFAAIAAGRTDYERSALPLVPVRVSRICCL